MFNRKLKKRIELLEASNKELETKVVELDKKLTKTINETKWIEWKCNNKPKHCIGDTVDSLVIKKVVFAPPMSSSSFMAHLALMLYFTSWGKAKVNHLDSMEILKRFNNNSTPTWIYHCSDSTTGGTVVKTEKELEELLKEKSA